MPTKAASSRQKIIRHSLDKIRKISLILMPIYWAFLTYMLLKPGEESSEFVWIYSGFDKIVHFCIFAALGILLLAAYPKIHRRNYFCIMFIYAILTEILQDEMRVGRSAELLDAVADFIGAAATWLLWRFITSRSAAS
ncbi:VanZ family protein [Cruoricaptor ignavus]